ncbi:SdrD B-like domain-containing protein [Amycolatopsis sp. NPDC004378]
MPTGRFTLTACGALTAALVFTGVTAAPASAETGPNLKVTATALPGRWLPGDAIPVDLTISNLGDTAATHVTGSGMTQSGPYFSVKDEEWGDLHAAGGASFAPGETRMYHLHGTVAMPANGNPVVEFSAYVDGDADWTDNTAQVTVPLVPAGTTDRIAGHLYGDRDRDGKPSPGEDIAGAEVHVIGTGMAHDVVATTDAAGRFAIDGLPVGNGFSWHFEKVPGGWVVPPTLPALRLDGSGANTALEAQAIRPLSDVLTASISLDKVSYAVGEVGTATVTLANTGDRPLTDLYAGCDPAGSGQGLQVPADQWGAFSPLHPAGQLAPGQRVVLHVSGKVPEVAAHFGRTFLDCSFDDGKTYGSGPYTYAEAEVPGMTADAKGQLWVDRNHNGQPDAGEGLAKTKVTLSVDGTHVVALAQTDANGYATFTKVPVGSYVLRPVGPWTTVGDAGVPVIAPPYGYGDWSVQVAPR